MVSRSHPRALVVGSGEAVSVFVSSPGVGELHAIANLCIAHLTSQSIPGVEDSFPVLDSYWLRHLQSFLFA